MGVLQNINDISKKKENYIKSKLGGLDKDVVKLQKDLLSLILSEYIPKFKVDDSGNILINLHNIGLIYDIDRVFDKFDKVFQKDVLKKYANDLLKLTTFNEQYYDALGVNKNVLDKVIKKLDFIYDSIGISPTGNIIKDSYLDSISQNVEVRIKVKDYVIKSVNAKTDLKTYTKGMKDLIVGQPGVTGSLQKYYGQYAYDTFNQVDATENLFIADELDLNAFIYAGTKITTTRNFCANRVGKVWTRKEGKRWNSLDWAGKKPGDFFINRGGYRCRHHLKWITDALAIRLRPELKSQLAA